MEVPDVLLRPAGGDAAGLGILRWARCLISQGMVYRVQCNPRVDAKLIVLMEAIDGAGVEAEG